MFLYGQTARIGNGRFGQDDPTTYVLNPQACRDLGSIGYKAEFRQEFTDLSVIEFAEKPIPKERRPW